jgi:hypothetical protein
VTTAFVQSRSLSLPGTRLTCIFTVSSLTSRRAAISGLGQALRDEPQQLRLPRDEPGQRGRGRRAGPGSQPDELADQAPGNGGREQGLAGGDHPHCVEKPLGGDVLKQEAAGPGAQCVEHVLIQVERGKDKDPRRRFSGPG